MKVYLTFRAYCDCGYVDEMEITAHRTMADALRKYYHAVCAVDVKDLKGVDFVIDYPLTPKRYAKWYKENGRWANHVRKAAGKPPLHTPK